MVTIELPGGLEEQLRARLGPRLDAEAKEALGIALYREGELSMGQLAAMLGKGVIETDDWLAERGVEIPMTAAELREELAEAKELRTT